MKPRGPRPLGRPLSKRRWFGDLYHALLVASWPTLLGLLIVTYVVVNCLFALIYLSLGNVIAHAHPRSFIDAFFFSVETMATLGYGPMMPVTLGANIVVTCEVFFGLLGLAMVTGLVFAKFAKPTARVAFSRYATIQVRDGVRCLMFRMANERGNQIVEAAVHVVLLRDETTLEGEYVRRFYDLPLQRERSVSFILTWTAVHQIDERSPLFGATHQSLLATNTQIIVSLTGLDESFSSTINARHDYAAEEIIWDRKLADILVHLPDGNLGIDLSKFHDLA